MAARRTTKAVGIDGKSPIRAAVLAAVVEQPGHGWDVARRARRRAGALWQIDYKRISPHLKWLVREGLVCIRQESTKRKPYLRDVYYPTERGLEAREEWVAAPLAAGVASTDLEVRLLFSTPADIPALLRAVAECRDELAEEIEQNAASHVAFVSHVGAMINLQRASVDKRLKAEVEWLQEVRAGLEELRDHPLPR